MVENACGQSINKSIYLSFYLSESVYDAEHEQSFVEIVGALGDFLLLVGAARVLRRFVDPDMSGQVVRASIHRLLVEYIVYAGVDSPFADGLAQAQLQVEAVADITVGHLYLAVVHDFT